MTARLKNGAHVLLATLVHREFHIAKNKLSGVKKNSRQRSGLSSLNKTLNGKAKAPFNLVAADMAVAGDHALT